MTKTVLKIEGMMCGHCEAHMNDTIRAEFDVKSVNSSHSKSETVIISKEPLDETKLSEAVKKTGYTLLGIETSPYESKGLFSFLKK